MEKCVILYAFYSIQKYGYEWELTIKSSKSFYWPYHPHVSILDNFPFFFLSRSERTGSLFKKFLFSKTDSPKYWCLCAYMYIFSVVPILKWFNGAVRISKTYINFSRWTVFVYLFLCDGEKIKWNMKEENVFACQ